MAIGFPPEPVFPLGIDSDRTLFLVHNTVEARLAVNNEAWADEIEVVPVGANDLEIWSENGFGNIEGELFYYDAVDKDANGKIFKLKRIARNLGGKKTKFNTAGVFVRSFIIAEHHIQLVDAIVRVEKFLGVECSDEDLIACPTDLLQDTLDCRIRRLFVEPPCADDHSCPDVDFAFEIVSVDACEGTVANFNVGITGNFSAYRLDFGDGNFTTSEQEGTHTFAPNAIIDPVVNVSNDRCEIIQTPTTRLNPDEPEQTEVSEPFEVPLPVVPDFPPIIIPDIDIPETTLEFPQILFPCLEAGDLTVPSIIAIEPPIPSVITFEPFPIPSVITIEPAVPSVIEFGANPLPTTIEFGASPLPTSIPFGANPLPETVEFGENPLPEVIEFGEAPCIEVCDLPQFAPISFGPCPSCDPISILCPSCPPISVEWGIPPIVSVIVSVVCPTAGPSAMAAPAPFAAQSMFVDDDFYDDGFDNALELAPIDNLGIPSEIKIVAPQLPDIKIVHDIPTKLIVEVPKIPNIRILTPEVPLPTHIEIVNKTELPKSIGIDASGIPTSITLEASEAVKNIKLEVPKDFPTSIKLDASDIPKRIKVEGFPDFIRVEGIPEKIAAEFTMPENIKVPLVYEGGPIPIKFSEANIVDDDGEVCFRLVPCTPK